MDELIDRIKVPITLTLFSLVSLLYRYIPSPDDFLTFVPLFTLHFVLYVALAYYGGRTKISVAVLIGVAIFNRFLLIDTVPILENDYFRYLWDGRVLANGINPYLYPPNSAVLDSLTVWYRDSIGWPEIRTIYPPLAELFFGGLHLLAPDSLIALKAGLILLELLAGLLLVLSIKDKSNRRLVTILYFFNPLLLKEISNSAHLDALPMFFSLAAVLCFMTFTNKRGIAWVILALSVAAKSYAILLVPLFIKLDDKRWRHLGFFGATLAALYLPFLGAGEKIFSGAGAFGTYWIFNAGIFKLLTNFINYLIEGLYQTWSLSEQGQFILANDYPAKVVVALILIWHIFLTTKRLSVVAELPRACLSILGALLLLSPVVNAWYVLWLLPFACIERSVPWLSFTFLVVAAYAWFWSEKYAPAIRMAEYLCLYLLLVWGWRKRRSWDHSTSLNLVVD